MAALGGCIAGVTAPAQADDALDENTYLSSVPIVLTASRLVQRVDEAPAAVTVIDRQMIKDSGAWDLSEVFRLVPGMYVAYHAARFYSTDSIVSYHGLMSETMSHRMQVLLDGRSVYSPLYGGVIWSDIPVALDDIDRIEVVRGPDAASYGANSFIGVINIITRHSAESQGKYLSLSSGEGREGVVARYGAQNGNLTWRMTAGFHGDQGEYNDIDNPELRGNPANLAIWRKNKYDNKRVRFLNFRGDYQINATDSLEFQFGYNGGPRQAGEMNDIYAPDKTADNQFGEMRWRRALDGGGELAVQVYHMRETSVAQLFDQSNTPPTPAGNGDVVAQRDDIEVQHTFSPLADTRLVWGGSVRQDRVFAPDDLSIDEDRYFRLSRLFGNLEWRARPSLIFNLGAMAENNNYTGTDITPRVAANWHFLPGHTLRASYSQATRTPSIYEKRYEEFWRANGYPNLPRQKPERVEAGEIGYLGKLGSVDVDFRLFREAYSDLIGDRKNVIVNNNINSGSATIKGFETQLKWQIGKTTRLIYSLSHAVVRSPNVDNIPYTNSVPTNNQSLMLTHNFDSRWSASLVGYQTGETHFSRTDFDLAQGRGYFIPLMRRWDGRVAYAFPAGKSKGELTLNIQNLADERAFEFRHDNQTPGRTAWLNLRLETD